MSEGQQPTAIYRPAERELRVYENLDLLMEALGAVHPSLGAAHQDMLWHVVWKLTGPDPAAFEAARKWLKVHDPACSQATATVESASTEEDAQKGDK